MYEIHQLRFSMDNHCSFLINWAFYHYCLWAGSPMKSTWDQSSLQMGFEFSLTTWITNGSIAMGWLTQKLSYPDWAKQDSWAWPKATVWALLKRFRRSLGLKALFKTPTSFVVLIHLFTLFNICLITLCIYYFQVIVESSCFSLSKKIKRAK